MIQTQLQTGLKKFQDVYNPAVRSISFIGLYLWASLENMQFSGASVCQLTSQVLRLNQVKQPRYPGLKMNYRLRNIAQVEPLWTRLGFFPPPTNKFTASVWHHTSLEPQEASSLILGSSPNLLSHRQRRCKVHTDQQWCNKEALFYSEDDQTWEQVPGEALEFPALTSSWILKIKALSNLT